MPRYPSALAARSAHTAPAASTALAALVTLTACAADAPVPGATTGQARSADGVSIHYEVHGAGEPALVLVHGWTNTRGIWGEHPQTLGQHHRVVALDLAGHGASGAERTTWSMDAFGEDVAAVVEQLGLEQVVLVGFSMGGAVVLEAAERMPERTAGIVFIDTFHDPGMAPSNTAEEMEAAIRTNWGDTAFLRAFALTPDAPDSLVHYLAGMLPAQPHEHWFAIMRAIQSWMANQREPTLQAIRAPVAAINTTSRPTNVQALRAYAPGFTVDTLHGVGHAGILLQRVEDFDAHLLAIVERFMTGDSRTPR
ncbi:MAG: alpha/beta hydrolase [Gemmatimonadota bacterium]